MNATSTRELRIFVAVSLAVLWTLIAGLAYALLGFSDEVTLWLSSVLGVPADIAQWLSTAALALEQWGGWIMAALWVLGLVGLAALYLLADWILQLIADFRRQGELS